MCIAYVKVNIWMISYILMIFISKSITMEMQSDKPHEKFRFNFPKDISSKIPIPYIYIYHFASNQIVLVQAVENINIACAMLAILS